MGQTLSFLILTGTNLFFHHLFFPSYSVRTTRGNYVAILIILFALTCILLVSLAVRSVRKRKTNICSKPDADNTKKHLLSETTAESPVENHADTQADSFCPESEDDLLHHKKNATSDYPFTLIDASKGLYYSGGQRDFYDTILEMYEEQGAEKEACLETAFANRNLADYRLHAHSLKSTARSIGAGELGALAEKLEHAARDEDFSYIEKHHGTLLDCFHDVLAEIRHYLQE